MGGGETNLILVIEELLLRGYEITVICPDGLLADALENYADIELIVNDDIAKRGWVRFVPLLWRQINLRRDDWDIIHFYSSNPIPRFLRNKAKKVWTVHGPWEMPYGLRGFFISFFISFITSVSKNVYSDIKIKNIPQKVVELGIKNKYRIKESQKKNIVNILCLGRFQKIKGQDLLLDAFINNKIDSNIIVNLKLVGGVDKSRIDDVKFHKIVNDKACALNNINNISVEIFGHNKKIEDLFHWADICVIPSRYESFSMVAVESLLNGVPIVVSNSGAPQSFVKKGKTGFVFENESAFSLFNEVMSAISSLNSLKKENFYSYKDRFSIERQVNEYCEIYNKIVE